jgi:hypothetical protein
MANSGTLRQVFLEIQDVLTNGDVGAMPVDDAQRLEAWLDRQTPKWEPLVIQSFIVLWHYIRNNSAVTTAELHEAVKVLADRSMTDAIDIAQLYLHQCDYLNEFMLQPFPHDSERALYCYKMAFRLALHMDLGTRLPAILTGIFTIYRERFQDADSFVAAFIQEADAGDVFAALWVGWFRAPERLRQKLLNNPVYQQKNLTLNNVKTCRDNLLLQVLANYSDFAKIHFQIDLAAKILPELSYAETIYYFHDLLDTIALDRPNTVFQFDMNSIRNFFVLRTDPVVIEDGRCVRFWHEPKRWQDEINEAMKRRAKHWQVNCPNTDLASSEEGTISSPAGLDFMASTEFK